MSDLDALAETLSHRDKRIVELVDKHPLANPKHDVIVRFYTRKALDILERMECVEG